MGSPPNSQAVDEVLERHRVLPLNIPPGYPHHNGSVERSMCDLKATLNQKQLKLLILDLPLTSAVELATHHSTAAGFAASVAYPPPPDLSRS